MTLIAQLLARYWKVILPVAAIGIMAVRTGYLSGQLEKAHKLHYDYVAQVSQDAATRAAVERFQQQQAQKFLDTTTVSHALAMQKILEVNNVSQKDTDRTIAGLRDRLRAALEASATRTENSTPQSPERLTEGGGDSHATSAGVSCETRYERLELGCAITTQDYNTLAERVERLMETNACFDR